MVSDFSQIVQGFRPRTTLPAALNFENEQNATATGSADRMLVPRSTHATEYTILRHKPQRSTTAVVYGSVDQQPAIQLAGSFVDTVTLVNRQPNIQAGRQTLGTSVYGADTGEGKYATACSLDSKFMLQTLTRRRSAEVPARSRAFFRQQRQVVSSALTLFEAHARAGPLAFASIASMLDRK